MKRHRRVFVGLSGLLLLVLAWTVWAFWPHPRVVDRIQPGMSLPEVVALVGRPPDSGMPTDLNASYHGCMWDEESYAFVVGFTDGRVNGPPTIWTPTMWERFKRRHGR
jgi:hypothetical protein